MNWLWLRSPHTIAASIGLGVVAWVYWPAAVELANRWATDPQYSHGYLVPIFAAWLLWYRRNLIPAQQHFSWWGIPLAIMALALYLAGAVLYFDWLSHMAILPCVLALFMTVFGPGAVRWCYPTALFLVFMIPLPYSVEVALAHPLQRVATIASTYALQTCGLPAVSEGNRILINDIQLNVVEACSGLRMLTVFFALSFGMVLVMHMALWERVVLVASAVPIAIVSNIIRIVVTGILHVTAGSYWADLVFHDLAGWLMMPLALVLLWLELRLLSHVIIYETPHKRRPAPSPLGLAMEPAGTARSSNPV